MSLFDRIRSLFGGGGDEPAEFGRHPDAQPIASAQNSRGPTDAEYAAAAAAQPERHQVESAGDPPPPDATLPAADRLDNPISDLEEPGVDTPPAGAGEPPR